MAGRFTVEAVFDAVDRMSRPIANIDARVTRFTRGMARGIRSADRALSGLASGIFNVGKRMAVVGGIAVAALALQIRGLATDADDLAKKTRLLDFDIEQFQEWRFAAKLAGLETQQFDKAVEQFTKRVGEARAGTGSMVTLLKKSNPELLKQLVATKDNAKAFQIFVKALGETEGAQNQVALANAAGGRSAARLTLLAKLGTKEQERLFKVQRENGNITKEQAAAAEAFNDQMASTIAAIKGVRNQALAPLLPMLTEVAANVRQWTIENKTLITTGLMDIVNFFKDNAADIIKWIKVAGKLLVVLGTLIVILKTLTAVMTVVNIVLTANPIGILTVAVGGLILALTSLVLFWDDIVAAWQAAPQWVRTVGTVLAWIVAGPLMGLIQAAQFVIKNWDEVVIFFDAFMMGLESVGNAIVWVFETIRAPIAAVIDWLNEKIDGLGTALGAIIDPLGTAVNLAKQLTGFGSSDAAVVAGAGSSVNTVQRDRETIRETVSPVLRGADDVTARSEVTIRDESGRAEVSRQSDRQDRHTIKVMQTGGF